MFLMIFLGLFTTLFGVALGGAVLELILRAMATSLAERSAKGLRRARPGSDGSQMCEEVAV